jgi:gamma-tubulin complex component 2
MAMLNEWLHHGGIKDPHAEFLVKEQKWKQGFGDWIT